MAIKQYIIQVRAEVLMEYLVESEQVFEDSKAAFDSGELIDENVLETLGINWESARMEVDG